MHAPMPRIVAAAFASSRSSALRSTSDSALRGFLASPQDRDRLLVTRCSRLELELAALGARLEEAAGTRP